MILDRPCSNIKYEYLLYKGIPITIIMMMGFKHSNKGQNSK